MRIDFRNGTPLPSNWATFQPKANFVHDAQGLHLWCRDGAGAGGMLKYPRAYGSWLVRSRISPGAHRPSTKVCLLLWPAGTGWPPEVDFNESGDRTRSNQTLHYSPQNRMLHTSYEVDQTLWHTFGVTVDPLSVAYSCDGKLRAAVENLVPGTSWNLHLRTEPHYDPVSETVLDVRWIEVPD